MLQVYNTLTRQKENFVPRVKSKVGMYVCGVTVYDYCHLGHARTYIAADNAIRYLQYLGFDVNYVRNITDIDDKIIKRALENNEAYHALTERFIQAMHEDFAALNLLTPNTEPRATAFIPAMIAMIETIIQKGQGYVASNGDVYFDVRRFKPYGCLSHHDLEQLESGARVEVTEAKHDPLDFVLWKLAKPNEPAWDSPWGKGRPGWHIECSAMAKELLGTHFDIHAGGRDLIFPHHENEIAQSEAATGEKFVNVWMHAGFLQIDKEKMSKSLGNFLTIRDVLAQHDPEVVRYLLSTSHYRSPLVYADDLLLQAKQALTRFYTALRFLKLDTAPQTSPFKDAFMAAMNDDFNTPVALAHLFELAHEIQRERDKGNLEAAAKLGALLKELGGVLGFLQRDPDEFFQSGDVNVKQIEDLITARQIARKEKDWSKADKLRAELEALGVVIEDGSTGTTWKKIT